MKTGKGIDKKMIVSSTYMHYQNSYMQFQFYLTLAPMILNIL